MSRVAQCLIFVYCPVALATSIDEARGVFRHKVEKSDLTCSACTWAARALRSALVDQMPKRVKSSSKREKLAATALATDGEHSACGTKRFPKDPVITGDTETTLLEPENAKRKKYSDLVDVRGGGSLLSAHFRLMESTPGARLELARVCTELVDAFGSEVISRVKSWSTGRVFS